jgi:hypothetical protein
MYGDGPDDALLRESWHHFCDALKEAGDLVFRDTAPRNPTTRATGMRQLARNIALALQFELENHDPRFPELLHYFDPVRKQGGDNTDALYVGAPINGTDTYRISGKRGTAAYFAVTVLEDGDTPWGGQVVGQLVDEELEVDDDGCFELVVSPREHPGNWIRSTSETYRITFRQFFADWENEEPMVARIDREGATSPPEPLTAQRLDEGLRGAAHWVRWSVTYWAEMLDKWQARPNEFISYGELESNQIDFTPGGAPLISYWNVAPDEACVIRVTPPRADYWAVEFGSYWWETMDYRYRLCSLLAGSERTRRGLRYVPLDRCARVSTTDCPADAIRRARGPASGECPTHHPGRTSPAAERSSSRSHQAIRHLTAGQSAVETSARQA